jgi:hypothetical protein
MALSEEKQKMTRAILGFAFSLKCKQQQTR